MKLHFTYNFSDLAQAIKIAEQTAEYADIIGVGSLLLFKEGTKAIKTFKAAFPNKDIFAETKIVEKADEAVTMMAQAGATYISVLAGTFNASLKKAVTTARRLEVKIALDLLDAPSMGQAAMDAKTLGADLLILHNAPHQDDTVDIDSVWHNVRDNTTVSIFVTGKIDLSNFQQVAALKPQGIMIGSPVTQAENPGQAAQLFRSMVSS
jgi:3-hexulose-6-phosphate synthase